MGADLVYKKIQCSKENLAEGFNKTNWKSSHLGFGATAIVSWLALL